MGLLIACRFRNVVWGGAGSLLAFQPEVCAAPAPPHPVQEVRYAKQLRYLIIVLREGEGSNGGAATRQALRCLKPNNQQLGDAHTGGQLVGVIATAQGAWV